jgi:hypothetical protein
MKKYLIACILIACAETILAQAPAQIPYQGVARDMQSIAIQNQQISLRLTIEDFSGTDLFQKFILRIRINSGCSMFKLEAFKT